MTDLNTSTLKAITVGISSQLTDTERSKTEDDESTEIIDEQLDAVSLLYNDLATTVGESALKISSSSREIDAAQTNAQTTSIVLSEMGTIPSAVLASEEGVPTPPPSPVTRKAAVRPR